MNKKNNIFSSFQIPSNTIYEEFWNFDNNILKCYDLKIKILF